MSWYGHMNILMKDFGQFITERQVLTDQSRIFQTWTILFNFSNIMATSFSGGRSRSTWREPPTMGKQLVNFITFGCESSTLFCNLQSRVRTHTVLVICLYKLLGNPTTRAPMKLQNKYC
jgi:hypothetical protein